MSASSLRTLALRNIQELLHEPDLFIKEPHSIRWLGLRNAVSTVFETYGSVLVTLSKFVAEKNPVAIGLLKYFCSYKAALVIAFVLDVHDELAVLSCEIQKENLLFRDYDLILYVPSTIFQLNRDGSSWVEPVRS